MKILLEIILKIKDDSYAKQDLAFFSSSLYKKVIATATSSLLKNEDFLKEVQALIDEKEERRNSLVSSKIEERRKLRRNKLLG